MSLSTMKKTRTAGLTAQQQREFEEWEQANEDTRLQISVHHGHAASVAFEKEKWGDRYDDYCAFVETRGSQMRSHMKRPMTRDRLFDMTKKTNFSDPTSAAEWLFDMEMCRIPPFEIGSSSVGIETCSFAIQVGPSLLWPNHDADDRDGSLLHRSIMGINTDHHITHQVAARPVSPRKRRTDTENEPPISSSPSKRRSLGKSTAVATEVVTMRTATLADADRGFGFVFAQLGPLYMAHQSKNNQKMYQPTNFGVVVRLDRKGRAGAVYIIYNFFEPGNNKNAAGETLHNHISTPLDECGYLGKGSSQRFTFAKIADSLDDLHPDKPFIIQVRDVGESQLVRAKLFESRSSTSRHWILRESVPEYPRLKLHDVNITK